MAGIQHADLQALAHQFTDIVRHECGLVRAQITREIDEVKREQAAQAMSLDQHAVAIARLDERAKAGAAGAGLTLSRRQKAGLATAAVPIVGALLDGLRHLVAFAIAAWKGGHS